MLDESIVGEVAGDNKGFTPLHGMTPLTTPELEIGAVMSRAGSCPPVTRSSGAERGRDHDVMVRLLYARANPPY